MTLITGQTGSGKTTILKALNYKDTYFADDYVKQVLYQNDHPMFEVIKAKFPLAIEDNQINIKKLGQILFSNKENLDFVVNKSKPFLEAWIKSLPKNSIIEMAGYINYEDLFSHLFDKVIVIERKNNDTSKLSYINENFQPIQNARPKKYDYVISNDETVAQAALELREILFGMGNH